MQKIAWRPLLPVAWQRAIMRALETTPFAGRAAGLQIKTVAEIFTAAKIFYGLSGNILKWTFSSFDVFIYRRRREGGVPFLSSRALRLMNCTEGCTLRISDILYFGKWERNLITAVFPESFSHLSGPAAILFYFFIPFHWTAKLMRNIPSRGPTRSFYLLFSLSLTLSHPLSSFLFIYLFRLHARSSECASALRGI